MKKVLLSVVATISLATATLAQSVPNYVPTNGLVGWWPFNGNANDESGNNNNGTVNGATLTADRFGNTNSAYSFDGINSFISVASTPQLNLNTGFTITAWVVKNINSSMSFVCKARQSNNTISYHLSTGNASPSISMGIGINNDPGGCSTCNYACGTINSDSLVWKHVAATWNGTTLQYYLDGSLISTCNGSLGSTGTLVSNSFDVLFGKYPNNTKFHNGKLDDIGIWNRALTQQEITDLHNANICYDHVTVTDTLIINTNMVGFNPVTYQNTIKVWPNPAHDHITIDNGNIANLSGYQIKISNVLGQQVFQSAINQQQFYINLSAWTGNGTYYINLINPQGVTVETRVIVVQ